MRMRRTISGSELGQSIIETLLMMPLLLTLLLNAANFAYYFLYLVHLTSSQRSGVEYAIMGGASTAATAVPKTGPSTAPLSVSYELLQDMTGGVYAPRPQAALQACPRSAAVGGRVDPVPAP